MRSTLSNTAQMTFLGLVVLLVSLPKIHGDVVRETKSPPSVTSTPPDTVSWQSAYWALVALSLNAMTQNSTLDHDFPPTILFPMRSSPLICAADAIEVLLRLFWYTYRARLSTPNAARRVVEETTWKPNQTGSTITLANQHPRSHTILFVLGVLPQAVKLFGMGGIPWTQVWASLYLSSYLVLAGVGALARRAKPTTGVPLAAFREGEGRLLDFGVVAAQVGVWLWYMWRLLSHVSSSTSPGSPIYVLSFTLNVISALGALHVIFFIWLCSSVVNALLTVVTFPVAVCLMSFTFSFFEDVRDHHMDSALTFWSLVLALVFTAGVMLFLRIFPAHFRAISFGVGNLVFSILYYRFLYDPRGTVKPPWAEELG